MSKDITTRERVELLGMRFMFEVMPYMLSANGILGTVNGSSIYSGMLTETIRATLFANGYGQLSESDAVSEVLGRVFRYLGKTIADLMKPEKDQTRSEYARKMVLYATSDDMTPCTDDYRCKHVKGVMVNGRLVLTLDCPTNRERASYMVRALARGETLRWARHAAKGTGSMPSVIGGERQGATSNRGYARWIGLEALEPSAPTYGAKLVSGLAQTESLPAARIPVVEAPSAGASESQLFAAIVAKRDEVDLVQAAYSTLRLTARGASKIHLGAIAEKVGLHPTTVAKRLEAIATEYAWRRDHNRYYERFPAREWSQNVMVNRVKRAKPEPLDYKGTPHFDEWKRPALTADELDTWFKQAKRQAKRSSDNRGHGIAASVNGQWCWCSACFKRRTELQALGMAVGPTYGPSVPLPPPTLNQLAYGYK